jgi:hypothetical protein
LGTIESIKHQQLLNNLSNYLRELLKTPKTAHQIFYPIF